MTATKINASALKDVYARIISVNNFRYDQTIYIDTETGEIDSIASLNFQTPGGLCGPEYVRLIDVSGSDTEDSHSQCASDADEYNIPMDQCISEYVDDFLEDILETAQDALDEHTSAS